MSTVFQRARQAIAGKKSKHPSSTASYPTVFRTEYTNQAVDIPQEFLAPLANPESIKVEKINFAGTALKEYKDCYAVVLDGVLSTEECEVLIVMAEKSVGAHASPAQNSKAGEGTGEVEEPDDNGWRPALVNAGRNHEILAPEYRNSDRIIWDERTVVSRIWQRVLQGQGMKEYLLKMEGKEYGSVFGEAAVERGESWVATKQGLNERMRFLRYGRGQFFKEHCDGTYETPDHSQRSFYTIHLYLNDSAQALGIPKSQTSDFLRGGATTFHSRDMKYRIDVDPLAGRVLIFQHRRLLHSGDEVESGIKYTVRSDLMYQYEEKDEVDDEGDVVFADSPGRS